MGSISLPIGWVVEQAEISTRSRIDQPDSLKIDFIVVTVGLPPESFATTAYGMTCGLKGDVLFRFYCNLGVKIDDIVGFD